MTDGDWRLMGQETWLTGRKLRRAEWFPHRDGWDHDHCAFCQVKITAPGPAHGGLASGYVTSDDSYTWICAECFEDFTSQFHWTVTVAENEDSSGGMQRRVDLSNIDLDAIADVILARRSYWLTLGLMAEPLTWMDITDTSGQRRYTATRSEVNRPRSVGVRIGSATDAAAEFVIYAGGWMDVDWVTPDLDQLNSEYVELDGTQDFAVVLDRIVGRLVMEEIPADSIQIGDFVELPAQPAPVLIRLTLIQPRTKGFKIEGRTDGGTLYSSSFAYGKTVRRCRMTGVPETPAD